MSSIMRARSGLMGRSEPSEVMGALPSRRLLDLRCSGSDALTVTRYSASPLRNCADRDAAPLPRAGSFFGATLSFPRVPAKVPSPSDLPTFVIVHCQRAVFEFTTYALESRLRAS